jgi:hypothetical protein
MAVKSTKKTKPTLKSNLTRGPESIAVGDSVRMPTEIENSFEHYDPRRALAGRGADTIEGLVCTIREIATGKLVAKTTKPLQSYVMEILQDRTFLPQFSANRNSGGPKGTNVVRENPNWTRVRGLLKEGAGRGELICQATGGLTKEPFVSILDGWRMVKIHANLVELL